MSSAGALRSRRGVGRAVGATVLVAVFGAAVSAVWFAVAARPRTADSTTAQVTTGTAAVTRGTVTQRVQIGGTLGYDGSYPVVHQGTAGVLTAVAGAGTRVSRGGSLYAVANQPVRLLYGSTPTYRDFIAGMSKGPDVRQLEKNLVALGMDPRQRITVDDRFTAATAAAIRRWKAAWGLPAVQRTGALSQGQVVFVPGAVQVGQVQAAVGTSVGPNQPVLSASSTNRVVTAQVTAERQRMVHVRDTVLVSLTGIAPFPGTVTKVGRVAASSGAQSGSDSASAVLPVTIRVMLPAGAADLDQAPAQVAITTQTRRNVLMVPATAILARPGGGYQVRLESGRDVQVQPGLFDETAGTVEVTGDLTVGELVEVPTS
jgi:hypothetical protein